MLGFCNKSIVLVNKGFICRSDSNSEDLPDFAGAGLFDSFPITESQEITPRYSDERLVVNRDYRV